MTAAGALRLAPALAPLAALLQMALAPLYALEGPWLGLAEGQRVAPELSVALVLLVAERAPPWGALAFAAAAGSVTGLLSLAPWEHVVLQHAAAALVLSALARRGWGTRGATRLLAFGAASLAGAAVLHLPPSAGAGGWAEPLVRTGASAALDAALAMLLAVILRGLAAGDAPAQPRPRAIRI